MTNLCPSSAILRPRMSDTYRHTALSTVSHFPVTCASSRKPFAAGLTRRSLLGAA